MNKRIIIKTSLMCFGVFLLLSAVLTWFFRGHYEFDRERRYSVVVANVPIERGTIINEGMLRLKIIKESSFNEHMLNDISGAAGTKALTYIGQDDYIREYELLPKDKWHNNDDRTIVLPLEVEERLANLIKKDTYVDIKLMPKDVKSVPQLVLSKIYVQDVLDENGVSLGNTGVNKKAFICLVLDDDARDRIYVARDMGKLIFELYCDSTQNPPAEEFEIPKRYMQNDVKY